MLRNLVLFFMYGKMQESGLTEIIPLMCTSAIWGQNPVFSHYLRHYPWSWIPKHDHWIKYNPQFLGFALIFSQQVLESNCVDLNSGSITPQMLSFGQII